MRKFLIVLLMISSLLILASCGGGGGGSEDDSDDNLSSLASMNITDAKNIFIRTGSGSGTANSSGIDSATRSPSNNNTNRLYKINNAGMIDEVSFFDKNHKKIELRRYDLELCPVLIENINENYIAVGFSDIYQASSNAIWLQAAIIARKSDGAIFKLINIPDCQYLNNYVGWGFVKNSRLFKSDNFGNIYYINQGWEEWDGDKHTIIRSGITKISVSGSNLTSKIITPTTDSSFYAFDIDSAGNIVYVGWSQLTNEQVNRLRFSAGNYKNVPAYSTIWAEQDGKFHYIDTTNNQDVKMINPETLESEPYGSFPVWVNAWDVYKVSLQGYTYLISSGGILEVYNSTAEPRTIALGGLVISNIFGVAATENYYYIAGKDSSSNCFLIKVVPGGTSYTTILGSGYQVYAFSASETDGITFNALDTSTMKKVLGKVSINGGEPTILDSENDNTQVIFLERIR